MRLRNPVLALLLSLTAAAALAPAAQARHDDRYRDYGYYRGRDRYEVRQREALRGRLFDLADRVRLAEREGAISRREADNFYRRLDRVRDFLRDDRYLTDSEYDRRMRDLLDIHDDLRDEARRYRGRNWDRYDWGYRR